MQVPFIKTPAEQLLVKLGLKVNSIGKYRASFNREERHTTLILTHRKKFDRSIAITKTSS